MSTLPELLVLEKAVIAEVVACEGEVSAELEERIRSIDLSLAEKVEAYNYVMEKLDLEADYWKQKAERAAEISKKMCLTREFMRDRLKSLMIETNTSELKGIDNRFALVKAKARLINEGTPEQALAEGFGTIEQKIKVDGEKIREALEGGAKLDWARLEPAFGLRVYPVTERKRLK